MRLVSGQWTSNQPGQWPIATKILVITLLSLVTGVGYYRVVLESALTEFRQVQDEESSLKHSFASYRIRIKNLPELQTQAMRVTQRLNTATQQLAQPTDLPYLIGEVARLAKQHQLELELARTGKAITQDPFEVITTELKLTGTYPAYLGFLQELPTLSHIATLHDVRITPRSPQPKASRDAPQTLLISATLNTYLHKE